MQQSADGYPKDASPQTSVSHLPASGGGPQPTTMSKQSAGILLYRERDSSLQVLLVHPGGPYWVNKDRGAWSIPKGLFGEEEAPLQAARREFAEETGIEVDGTFMELGSLKQPGGKTVHAWAIESDLDPSRVQSNTFTLEWPPKSGRHREYPEVDRACWFDLEEAGIRIHKGQAPFLQRLREKLGE